ncbi:MAG: T9SS type A sorting domain-containing protein [candidate division KSB1 bacterium]|nr:T9SS type A sorting domain-containing protein [candidate division KSB1 bacterium]
MRLLLLFLSLISLSGSSQGQVNDEFRVNTCIDSLQREPAIAMNASGNYVVVWTSFLQDGSAEGIYGQRFNARDDKIGAEFQVNQVTPNAQSRPAVAMNDAGQFVVAWSSTDSSSQDIRAQLFDANGNRVGGEILVNTTTADNQNTPSVAIDRHGNFCVVWHSWGQDGGDRGVYGQRFRPDGARLGEEFLVNTTTKFSQANPCIAMAPDGQFVVIWESWMQDGTITYSYDVFGQLFNADGTKNGSEFRVNTYTTNYQWLAKASMARNGNFVVVWTSWKQDGDNGGIYGQRFLANGDKIGEEFLINTTTKEYQWLPNVAIDQFGNFVVVWSSWKQDGSREGVCGQFFDKHGNKLGIEFQVNRYTDNYQWEPVVAMSDSGEAVVAWSSWGQDKNDYEVYARRILLAQTSVQEKTGAIPERYELHQNYPNPFNPRSTIRYEIPDYAGKAQAVPVQLKLYDPTGREVKSLVNEFKNPGRHQVELDGHDLPAGIYFYQLLVAGKQPFLATRKLVVMK